MALEDAAIPAPRGLSAKPSSGRKLVLPLPLLPASGAAAACRRRAYPVCCEEESAGRAEALRDAFDEVTDTRASEELTEGSPLICSRFSSLAAVTAVVCASELEDNVGGRAEESHLIEPEEHFTKKDIETGGVCGIAQCPPDGYQYPEALLYATFGSIVTPARGVTVAPERGCQRVIQNLRLPRGWCGRP